MCQRIKYTAKANLKNKAQLSLHPRVHFQKPKVVDGSGEVDGIRCSINPNNATQCLCTLHTRLLHHSNVLTALGAQL